MPKAAVSDVFSYKSGSDGSLFDLVLRYTLNKPKSKIHLRQKHTTSDMQAGSEQALCREVCITDNHPILNKQVELAPG